MYLIKDDGRAIMCLKCGNTSHNPGDVAEKYCANCGLFHSDIDPDEVLTPGRHIAIEMLCNHITDAEVAYLCKLIGGRRLAPFVQQLLDRNTGHGSPRPQPDSLRDRLDRAQRGPRGIR